MTDGAAAVRRGARPPLALRSRIALVIALLAILPNVLLVSGMLLPGEGGPAPELVLAGVLWGVAVVILSAIVGFLASKQLLAPLLTLTREVRGLTGGGGRLVGARLAATANEPAEVASLREAFNRLLVRIELEQSRRNAFIATLMHDLKTPLVAGSHLLEVVRDRDDLGRTDRVEIVDRLLAENRSHLELIQKLVDAHKFDRDEVPLVRRRVLVDELASRVAGRLAPLARERGVELRVEGSALAWADPAELERALYNLVANAVRYARSLIAVEILPGVVRVSDDGPGLPAPLERLAQPFEEQPVEISGHEYSAGTAGLGLFIARRVLEAHGGRLDCERTGTSGTVLLAYLGTEGDGAGPAGAGDPRSGAPGR